MTIAEAREKCKSLIGHIPRDAFIIAILILASSLSFGLGYFAGLDAGQATNLSFEISSFATTTASEQVVASKTGTKYYPPQCTGADRISDANKIWFVSAAAAQAAGYAPATHCSTGL